MKILIADQFSDLGGAQQVLLELLPALQAEGWSAVLALPSRGELWTRAVGLGIRCEEITCGPFGFGTKGIADLLRFGTQLPEQRRQLRCLVDDFCPDVLYVNAPRLVPAACSLGHSAPPILFHLHSYLGQRSVARMTAWFLRRARASVVANCHFVVEPMRESLGNVPVEVVYNGVRDCACPRVDDDVFRIGVIGRISPGKGQRVFIEAARSIHLLRPRARFVICGGTQFSDAVAESHLLELRKLAAGLPLEFTDWRDDISDVLRNLDLLVVPSMPLAEATTRVIPEAYAAGVPVLASDLPGIREVLVDGETGFLFQAGDSAALARKIREIMDGPAGYLAPVVANARRAFEDRFSIDVFHRRMISSLRRVGTRARA